MTMVTVSTAVRASAAPPVRPSGVDRLPPIVLAAHGSQDPRSAAAVRRLAGAVAARWSAPVAVSFLEFNHPSVAEALRHLASLRLSIPGGREADGLMPVVIPVLLTSAYHDQIDLAGVLGRSGFPTRLTSVLGPAEPGEEPDPRLLGALRRRLSELEVPYDGVVLLAAGTSWVRPRSTVETVASALARTTHVPCVVGYASASLPTGADAVLALRALGARRIVAASYFLAPGRLYDLAAASARTAGALAVAQPLGAAEDLVSLILGKSWGTATQQNAAAGVDRGFQLPRGGPR